MDKDYYKILGIHPDSTDDEIKEAYRRKAHRYHPDKGVGADAEKFKILHEAYEVLSTPIKRVAYDKQYRDTPHSNGNFSQKQSYQNRAGAQDFSSSRNFNQTAKKTGKTIKKVANYIWIIAIAVALVSWAVASIDKSPALNNTTPPYQASAQTNLDTTVNTTPTSIQLPVTILPTDDGISGSGVYADKYPKSITLDVESDLSTQLAAYGAAYNVWIALKGWNGHGLSGADGSTGIDLYPTGGNTIGEHISYSSIPACMGCMYDAAAPYFANAQQSRDAMGEQNSPTVIPDGLQVTPISTTLITYSLPDTNGLSTRGVVYYFPGNKTKDPYYADAKFVLPSNDKNILNFLTQTFIKRENLQ